VTLLAGLGNWVLSKRKAKEEGRKRKRSNDFAGMWDRSRECVELTGFGHRGVDEEEDRNRQLAEMGEAERMWREEYPRGVQMDREVIAVARGESTTEESGEVDEEPGKKVRESIWGGGGVIVCMIKHIENFYHNFSSSQGCF
jgi:hypothetical protein